MSSLALDDDRLIRMALANGLDAVGIAPVVLPRLMAAANQAPPHELPLAPHGEPLAAHAPEEHHVFCSCTH